MARGRRFNEYRRPRGAAPLAASLLLLRSLEVHGDAPKRRPNLLLLFPDQWRWDWAGFNPGEADLRMPNLQRMAEGGTRFTAAYTPSPWCAPSRACLATGKDWDKSPKTLNGADFPIDVKTFYTALREVGYRTILIGKDDLTQSRKGTGLGGVRHADELGMTDWFRMQDKYVTYRRLPWDQFGAEMLFRPCGRMDGGPLFFNLFTCNMWCYGVFGTGQCCKQLGLEGYNCEGWDQVGENQEDYIDNFVNAKAESILDTVTVGEPWMMQLSYPGPHPPFVITELMNRSIANREFAPSRDNQEIPEDVQRSVRKQYAAEIENLDVLFGRMVAKVASRGELDNTIIVVCSDHGEQLGDHNVWGKRQPWEPSLRVPLIVSGPGVAKNRIVDLPVSILDVVGLFLDRAGVPRGGFDTHTLEPLLQAGMDEAAYLRGRPFVPSGLTYEGRMGRDPPVDFRAIIQRVNATHTMKVLCCPAGCPVGNSHVPSDAPMSQLLAFNVGPGGKGDTENLNDTDDARRLARNLPGMYATACLTRAAVERLQPVEPLPQHLPDVPIIIEPAQRLPPAAAASVGDTEEDALGLETSELAAGTSAVGAAMPPPLPIATSAIANGRPVPMEFELPLAPPAGAAGERATVGLACVAIVSIAFLGLVFFKGKSVFALAQLAKERPGLVAAKDEANSDAESD